MWELTSDLLKYLYAVGACKNVLSVENHWGGLDLRKVWYGTNEPAFIEPSFFRAVLGLFKFCLSLVGMVES